MSRSDISSRGSIDWGSLSIVPQGSPVAATRAGTVPRRSSFGSTRSSSSQASGVDGYHTVIPGTPGLLDRDLLVDDLDGDDDPDIAVVGQDNVMGVLENAIEGRPGL